MVQLVGPIPLLQPAAVHDADAVGNRERFLLVVRDQHRGGAAGLEDAPHLGAEPLAHLYIEIRERLVHQQQPRGGRQRAGQRYALLLAAGKLMRIAGGVCRQADQIEHFSGALSARVGRGLAQPEGHVIDHAQMREQRIVLEYEADATLLGRDVEPRAAHACAIDADGAAVDADEPGNRTQQCGLAAAGAADDAADVAVGKIERQRVDHRRARAVADREAVDRQQRGAGGFSHGSQMGRVSA